LLVRLAGLDTHARDPLVWGKMILLDPLHFKSLEKMVSIVKRLGQGGPMRFFLDRVQHFTRGLRIVVGAWRWIEAAQCFRLEVGVEEFMVRLLKSFFFFFVAMVSVIPGATKSSSFFHPHSHRRLLAIAFRGLLLVFWSTVVRNMELFQRRIICLKGSIFH
jgi:hypothetical protein